MKKTILIALTTISFFLLPLSKVLAQTIVGDTHEEIDLTGNTFINCDGTVVTLQGTQTIDIHYIINKNGASVTRHFNATLTATDANGNTYIGKENNIESDHGQIPLVNGGFSFSRTASFRFVSQGSAPNFSFRIIAKYTLNANDEVTVDRYDIVTSCD